MNAHVVAVFDETVFALFKPRNFVSDAMMQAAVDRHLVLEPARMSFAFPSVHPE
jgi:hypothetical protein